MPVDFPDIANFTMLIYVNGDSWSWNADLKSNNFWPNILAKKLDAECINESVGCGSNSRIVDCLRNQLIQGLRPDLIVIALTSHHRCHIPAPNFGYWNIGPAVALNDSTGHTDKEIVKWILTHSYQEIDSVYRYYRDVWTMSLLCQQFSCPYLLIQAWDEQLEELNLLEYNENISKYVNNHCEPNLIDANNYIKSFETFRMLKKTWKYVETSLKKSLNAHSDFDPTGHPNDQGHRKMAEKIYQHLQELKVI